MQVIGRTIHLQQVLFGHLDFPNYRIEPDEMMEVIIAGSYYMLLITSPEKTSLPAASFC